MPGWCSRYCVHSARRIHGKLRGLLVNDSFPGIPHLHLRRAGSTSSKHATGHHSLSRLSIVRVLKPSLSHSGIRSSSTNFVHTMNEHFNEVSFVFSIPHLANHLELDARRLTRTCIPHGKPRGPPTDPGQRPTPGRPGGPACPDCPPRYTALLCRPLNRHNAESKPQSRRRRR